ncbi:DNA mismatch repair protein MutS [Pectinatus haikarae]|uniref:DNA mismatch repair protein MutS n=1 Tax=Pectinatus haikarae TaxID=349096 RepID=A0ABT9Y7A4_9FIRM|nr:DNA mismatch repair protein MutS [Pectinatus haikarae]MDQ0203400.1 DNA mismatch repair protein MutS [Pectinatus haikarae]
MLKKNNERLSSQEITPMMQQYYEMKGQSGEAILFFRLGDFYEMFDEDAQTASRELELTLTARSKIPMCGIPYHAAESYINRLINKGYKVAICEQIGDPKAKGLTKREIIKIITPGTVMDESALPGLQNNYIVLIHESENILILSGADISTGECFYSVYEGPDRCQTLCDELYRLMMAELLIISGLSCAEKILEFLNLHIPKCVVTKIAAVSAAVDDRITEHFAAPDRPAKTIASAAIASLLDYLHAAAKTDLSHLNHLTYLDASANLVIDTYTLRNLEITHNLHDGGKSGTLFSVLDFTGTAMGSRKLSKWLEYPLLDRYKIEQRLDAVEELSKDFSRREQLSLLLKSIYDFERLLTRVEVGSANARDMLALKKSLYTLPELKDSLHGSTAAFLQSIDKNIKTYSELVDLLEKSIDDNPGFLLRDGGIIKDGFDEELDEYRHLASDSQTLLQQMENEQKQQTGIKSLKISYNKVFGYFIEIRKSNLEQVPADYIRKQTLVNTERYITPELKEFETKILGAQEKILQIEYRLFAEIREEVKKHVSSIQTTAQNIACLDVITSFAAAAAAYNYIRPTLNGRGGISIKDGRHPLIERILTRELFVPNDTMLDNGENEILIITGPNMAGKSTYMRQTALLTLMAQAGSFIPAREAVISPVDRIFTRIGASDDLASGQSTFMVEMNEVAHILKYATKNSLIILDEIGRGTSTFDGMSIARAVIEYIRDKVNAKTLFATHYHELTDLADEKHVKNYCVAVKEKGSKVSFLRRIISGSADKSYGIHVAKLAGLPKAVTDRAEKILVGLEAADTRKKFQAVNDNPPKKNSAPPVMDTLFASALNTELLNIDITTMTPLEAMNILYKLQQQARRETGKL